MNDSTDPPVGSSTRGRRRARASAASLVVGALLIGLSVPAVWIRNQMLDTDRYVRNVAPLAEDPAIQDAASDAIARSIIEAADFPELAKEVLPDRAGILAGPIARGAERLVEDVADRVVRSEEFSKLWVSANRVGHRNLVSLLTGGDGDDVLGSTDDTTVTLQLGPLTARVARIVQAQTGIDLESRIDIDRIDTRYVLVDSTELGAIRTLVRWIDRLAWLIPALALAALAASVFWAGDRRAALLRVGLAVAGVALLLRLGLSVGRSLYLDGVPPSIAPEAAAAAAFDTLSRFLLDAVRALFGIGALLVVASWLSARRVRSGPVVEWVARSRNLLRVGTVTVGALVAMSWSTPPASSVVRLVVAMVLALVLIEVMARSADASTPVDPDAPVDPITPDDPDQDAELRPA